MAKASAVAARQAHAVQSMEERLANLEAKTDAILEAVGGASIEGVVGEAFGTLKVAIDDEQVRSLVEAVKQLSDKAGVDLMPFDTQDPIPHIIAQIGLVADRLNTPVLPPNLDQPEGAKAEEPKPSGKNK